MIFELFLFFIPFKLFDSLFAVEDECRPAAVAVLFHGYNLAENGIDRETERRVNYGIEIANISSTGMIFLIGGNSPAHKVSGAFLMASYCKNNGIREKNIIVDNNSLDSNSNIIILKTLISNFEANGNVALVSSFPHLLRIKHTVSGLDKTICLSPYNLTTTEPIMSKFERLSSINYNLALLIISKLLPKKKYENIVKWVRVNTKY